ncbi:hypothetical protein [Streptomyces sp. NPDC000405]|uniref:hypothetical protein n=1 Tax=Streptomyces sp. NPDC000405 TaxID=3161033 RepID=UPI00398CB1AF
MIAKTQAAMSTEAEKWRSRPGRYGRYHLQPLQRRQHHWNDVENELCAVMPMGTLRMLTPEEQTAIAQCLEQLPPPHPPPGRWRTALKSAATTRMPQP